MSGRPRSLVHVGTLFLFLSVPFWMSLPSTDSASSIVLPEVRERALREGRVRVIAEMRLPAGRHVPESLLSAAALGVQREALDPAVSQAAEERPADSG